MIDKKCYIQVVGHKREDATRIAHQVAKLMGKEFEDLIEYGYEPEIVRIYLNPRYPAHLAFQMHEKIEGELRTTWAPEKLEVSLEVM